MIPLSDVVGGIAWDVNGEAWAVVELDRRSDRLGLLAAEIANHSATTRAFAGLTSTAVFCGIAEIEDPVRFVGRLTPTKPDPRWDDHLRTLCATPPERGGIAGTESLRRSYWAWLRLPPSPRGWQWVGHTIARRLSLIDDNGPSEAEIGFREAQAARLLEQLAPIGARLATANEVEWLIGRTFRRGSAIEPTRPARDRSATRITRPRLRAAYDVAVKEIGGRDGRHVEVVAADTTGVHTSMQMNLALVDLPERFSFPGLEWLWEMERAGRCDWCVRIEPTSNDKGRRKATRARREVTDSFNDFAGDLAGVPASTLAAHELAVDLQAELTANPGWPLLGHLTWCTVYGDDLDDVRRRATHLVRSFGGDVSLVPPTGAQVSLLNGSVPAGKAPSCTRAYRQFHTPRDLAGGAPFSAGKLGARSGDLLGFDLLGGLGEAFLWDWSGGTSANFSPSIGVVGDMGDGKTYSWAKRTMVSVIASGGQVLVIDRNGEYVRVAEEIERQGLGTVAVIEAGEGGIFHSIDPLSTIGDNDTGRSTAIDFLCMLGGFRSGSAEADAIAAAVDKAPRRSIAGVVDVLNDAGSPAGQRLAHRLRRPLARAAADESLPPAPLSADVVIIRTSGLELPKDLALDDRHDGHFVSQAMLYLYAATIKASAFRQFDRFAMAVFDEAWSLLSDPRATAMLLELVRDGRKHNAAAVILSQSSADFPDIILEPLGMRVVGRVDDIDAAIAFLGLEPDGATNRLRSILSNHGLVGEGRFVLSVPRRGSKRDICWVQVLRIPNDALHEASRTDQESTFDHGAAA